MVAGAELKKKKARVAEFLLAELLSAPSELKFSKIVGYFEDAVTCSDFRQIFAEPRARALIISIVVKARTHSALQSSLEARLTPDFAEFLRKVYPSLLLSSRVLRGWAKARQPGPFDALALRQLEAKLSRGASVRKFARNLFFPVAH